MNSLQTTGSPIGSPAYDPRTFSEITADAKASLEKLRKMISDSEAERRDEANWRREAFSPKGLKELSKQLAKGELVEAAFSSSGFNNFREYNRENSKLHGQEIIGTKTRGVEPGFVARKTWSKKDRAKLYTEGHKYHEEAVSYLSNVLHAKLERDTSLADLLLDQKIYEQVKRHIMSRFPKFSKDHYWKLHYSEPFFNGMVKTDYAQSKGLVHQLLASESRRNKNLGALTEVLANEIYNILEFGGQKLSLRLAKYQDGHPMFLLDATGVTGPNGEKFQTLADSRALLQGPMSEGRIKNNMLPCPDSPDIYVPINERQLGSALLKSLLMGDRDKVGPDGGNIGYIVAGNQAILMNIDPGKSFEESCFWRPDRMREINIYSDCNFDQMVSWSDKAITLGYKNFSVFCDTTLADKMHGMRDILKHWGEVEKLFEKYINFFKECEADLDPEQYRCGENPMWVYLENQFKRLEHRKNMFERILGDRLKLSDDELNLLDNLEKLCSPTSKKAYVTARKDDATGKYIGEGFNWKDDVWCEVIDLKHLRIVDPKINRTEFYFNKSENGICPVFVSKNSAHKKEVIDTWNRFRSYLIERKDALSNLVKEKISVSNGSYFFINLDAKELLKIFSEENIHDYKQKCQKDAFEANKEKELEKTFKAIQDRNEMLLDVFYRF